MTRAAARRIALAAQGFGKPRPARPPSVNQIAALVRQLGLLQLDSVNVFSRSHYMPVFSRLGPYDRSRLDRIAGHGDGKVDRRLIEYWAHEASLIPVELHPLFRWRMADVDREAWGSISRIAREQPELVAETLELVSEQGPIRARDTGAVRPPPRPGTCGTGTRARSRSSICSSPVRSRPPSGSTSSGCTTRSTGCSRPRSSSGRRRIPAEAQRELVRIAARALGVATEPDIGDYFRLPRADSKARVAELAAAGELVAVEVEGWNAPAYLWPDARRPRKVHARALLTPFDSLIWFRQRTERLFGFRYRIEIYTPAPKRVYGYYVLPFLLGDTLVGRVDLKSDRQRGALLVQGAFAEDGVDVAGVAVELAAELRLVASWLDLGEVVVARAARGDLAGELAAIIG